ncbi:dolichyl-phosphate-mannose-protein mannosyltransferase [Oxobacter pfennigii]|uniref:Dolichyl-phosphate-mannose-protein mannosyltransferase n=1 Tax=Oxobacter pfennigii TaxID=36849 RepID=A0A0N8NTN4_9CLOT|nr:glycosyltransferase family 39 protein [Oxobacter pfennigii]KPU45320.1 dolichyl-phosphate-mannose-protein mannosyltransferase [Oxobacter pfennigii]
MINYIDKDKKYTLYFFIVIYISINLMYLKRFPFVHSDEPWLSGLARNMSESTSFSVTEAFFDLYIRNPHAIKIFFHSMQILFMKIFGYGIQSFRLLSFLFGLLVLYYQYKLAEFIFRCQKKAYLAVLFLALDVQFIYASHFARQEIIVLFVLIYGLYYYIKNIENHKSKHDVLIGTIIGLSIGLHPNSFVISLPFGIIYLYDIFVCKRLKIKNFLIYVVIVSVFAALFILLSLSFDTGFFSNYAAYGEQFDILAPVTSKFMEVKEFYLKLFYGISGTYYTPNIRIQFFIFPVALVASLYKIWRNKKSHDNQKIAAIILSIIAVNAGIILIGRYNQTSIVLIFPLFYILAVNALWSLRRYYYKRAAASILATVLCGFTIYNALPYINSSYDNYLKEISKAVKKDDKVLANLNAEYYFENGKIFDYRNLAFLKENNMNFEDYIYSREIKYIVYPEEMDFIYNQRPKWDGLYGELYYYEDMQEFIKNSCTLVYEFSDRVYGMRIARYINTRDWSIKIYRVDHPPLSKL